MAGILKFSFIALKNLFSKPATKVDPHVPARQTAGMRGAVQVNMDECSLCGACEDCCPASAIAVNRKMQSWTIRPMCCVQCGQCVENCPDKCLTMVGAYPAPGAQKREETFRKGEASRTH